MPFGNFISKYIHIHSKSYYIVQNIKLIIITVAVYALWFISVYIYITENNKWLARSVYYIEIVYIQLMFKLVAINVWTFYNITVLHAKEVKEKSERSDSVNNV